jgi:glycine cleavage system H protein
MIMDMPKDLRYTNEHEWVRKEGDSATIGITDYAQQLLGDVVYVEMPEAGASVTRGESFGVVESVKAASDIYAPGSGEVVEIHQELDEHPEYINQSPYGQGWIIKVKLSNPSEVDELMDQARYQELVMKESEKG